MKKILASFLLICGVATSKAQEVELDPVTITSSLVPTKTSQTGRNIISFNGKDIANMPVHSLDELLRYLPGLEVQMRGPMGAQSDIVLRGGTFQQVLVLLDGVRLNDPNTGHFNSYIPITPAEIDHIEVLKGASSAIYGSEAVGGVIHVITKAFAAKQAKRLLNLQSQLTGGEYNLAGVNIGGYYQHDNTVVSGGFLSNNSKGQLQRGTRGYVHNNTGSLSFTQFLREKWQVSLRVAYDHRDFAAQNFYTSFLSDTADEQVRSIWTQARVSYHTAKHRVSFDAGYKDVSDEYQFNPSSIANKSISRLTQGTLTDEWEVKSTTKLTTGVQVIGKSIRSNDRGKHEIWQGAAFAVLTQNIGKDFTINPALRLEYNERSGTELIPQLNLSYRPGKFQVRGSIGKTIRDADFTERFNNYNKAVVASGRIGNPDLKAEHSVSYEAGVDYFSKRHLKISAGFFQRQQERLIDYVTTPYADMPRKDNLVPNAVYALAKNIAKVTTKGFEVDVQYDKAISTSQSLLLGGGLVWLDSKSGDAAPSFYLSSHAKFQTNFFASWRTRYFSISVNGLYKERTPQTAAAINAKVSKDYFVMNTKFALFPVRKNLSVFVAVDNVFDQKYSDLVGAIMPQRWFSAGVNFNFSQSIAR